MFSLWDQKGAERALNVNFLCSLHAGAGDERGRKKGPGAQYIPHTEFIVRFSRYSIYKVQPAFHSRGQLLHTSTSFLICQELFSSFFKFLRCVVFFCRPRGQLRYNIRYLPICQYLFSPFFKIIPALVFRCLLSAVGDVWQPSTHADAVPVCGSADTPLPFPD